MTVSGCRCLTVFVNAGTSSGYVSSVEHNTSTGARAASDGWEKPSVAVTSNPATAKKPAENSARARCCAGGPILTRQTVGRRPVRSRKRSVAARRNSKPWAARVGWSASIVSPAVALLSTLNARRAVALAAGGADKLAERHNKGQLSARERLEALFEPGTFMKFGLHAQHACHDFGMAGKSMPGDGVITGVGYVEGRPLAAFSQDFAVGGGALGRIHSKKVCDLMDYAMQAGMPVLGINDSGGARIQEGDESLSGYGQVFFRNVLLFGVVPQISIIAGPCAGGAAYSPALTDFLIMTRDHANMFICGPEVIKAATGQQASLDQFATAEAHASVSGNVHFVAENELHALAIVRKLLSFLPLNNVMDPPHRPAPTLRLDADPGMNDLIPEDPKSPQ